MFFGGDPNCAKLFTRIKELDNSYGTNIENICATDQLSDTLGLTVIFPDKEFIKTFNALVDTKTPEMTNLVSARKMLQNTIIKRDLQKAEDFKQFTHSLPLRSGLTLNTTDIHEDTVILEGNIKLKKDDKFKSPPLYNYSLWIVESGNYPTTVYFRPKRNKPSKPSGGMNTVGHIPDTIDTSLISQGLPFDSAPTENLESSNEATQNITGHPNAASDFMGGSIGSLKDGYLLQVGRLLKDSPDTLRVSIMASILNEYKIELLRNRCARRNPLLVKAASLYNWLELYYPNILEVVLPITDIHPGVNLMLLILDPLSPITMEMLLGTANQSDPIQIADGWRGVDITEDGYGDWSNYLSRASKTINSEQVLNVINKQRNQISQNTSLDYASAVALVKNMYNNVSMNGSLDGVMVIPQNTLTVMYKGDKFKDRKIWQDQLRFVATCAFSGSCDGNIVSGMDIDDELSQAVRFRPLQGYTNACTFTVLQGNYSSKDDYYAFLKWLYSTDLMYVPQALDSRLATSTSAPYNGLEYGKASRTQILNNDYIKTQMVDSMKGASNRSASLTYAMAWANKIGLAPGGTRAPPSSIPIGGDITQSINLGSINNIADLANEQGVGYASGWQTQSNNYMYGVSQPGQDDTPQMYGETYGFPKGREIPWQNWGQEGGDVRASSAMSRTAQNSQSTNPAGGWFTNEPRPVTDYNNLMVSE